MSLSRHRHRGALNRCPLRADNLKKSKKWIAVGWLCTFIAPFVISVVPMRMFVNWEAFDPVREAYFSSFQSHYRLQEKEDLLRATCEPIVNGS